ncbi:response regulator transcription factor [Virgibacillus halodenitrificans]|uniref:response regulator transcription factor n=1 Tax=Virgibacillus halodenitrificans TaxID=1482 RepID=UPI002DBDB704|nr:response regulator transcription factor [Virgibacillus halodenitrificans]MEC2158588.1 response regulator transcription factor [Virgibacillus halodenitrificans]
MEQIQVMIVEEQSLMREGIAAIIDHTDDMSVAAMADSGQTAIDYIRRQPPDVVLLDLHMEDLDGIKTASIIKKTWPSVQIIFLTSFAEEELILRGIDVGGAGFLLREIHAQTLVRSIRQVHDGDVVYSGQAARILINKIRELTLSEKEILGKRLENRGIHLTKRELDITFLFMKRMTNKQIAQKLYLGEGTVKNYISEIYNKLGNRNRKHNINFLKEVLNRK